MSRSLLRQTIAIFIVPVILILSINYGIQKQMQEDQKKNLAAYCTSTLENININFSLLISNTSKTAAALSTNRDVQLYMIRDSKDMDQYTEKANFSDIVDFSRIFFPHLHDIVLCSKAGNTTSLVGYLSSNLNSYIKSLSEDAQSIETPYNVYTNPKTSNVYIVYLAPVYVTKFSSDYGKYIGSTAIVCKSDTISKIINSTNDIFIEVVNNSTGEVLFSNSSLFSKEDLSLLRQSGSMESTSNVAGTNMSIKGTYSTRASSDFLSSDSNPLNGFLGFVGLASVLCLVYLAIATQLIVIRPINRLNTQIQRISFSGDDSIRIKSTSKNEIGSIANLINQMLDKMVHLNSENLASKSKLYEMEISKKQTQLYAYQSQINPHFLYNMLQCMRSISLMNGMRQLADICTNKAALFRYSIKGENYVCLKDEISIIDKYLYMISIRFQDRISYQFEIDEAAGAVKIPKMILQPIVENAVFHGLEKISEKGRLLISAKCTGSDLIITIQDNGIGFPPDKLREINGMLTDTTHRFDVSLQEDKGLGIINIHNKIRLYEGDDYGILIRSSSGNTEVILKLNAASKEALEEPITLDSI